MKLTGFAMEIDLETLQHYGLEILLIFVLGRFTIATINGRI